MSSMCGGYNGKPLIFSSFLSLSLSLSHTHSLSLSLFLFLPFSLSLSQVLSHSFINLFSLIILYSLFSFCISPSVLPKIFFLRSQCSLSLFLSVFIFLLSFPLAIWYLLYRDASQSQDDEDKLWRHCFFKPWREAAQTRAGPSLEFSGLEPSSSSFGWQLINRPELYLVYSCMSYEAQLIHWDFRKIGPRLIYWELNFEPGLIGFVRDSFQL